jgi:hypothetical protein
LPSVRCFAHKLQKFPFFRNPFLRHNPCVFCLLPFLRN